MFEPGGFDGAMRAQGWHLRLGVGRWAAGAEWNETSMRTLVPSLIIAAMVAPAPAAFAQANDAARAPVQALSDGLIAIMKGGKAAGVRGRAATIGPVVDRVYDVPLMTRLTIGTGWNAIAPADQAALVAAFRRMIVGQYANNFDSFDGQKFAIDPKVESRGTDALVRTTLIQKGEDPIPIAYRLRSSGGGWKIVDVFYRNAISQLATRRSDFSRVLATGGAKALIRHLDDLAAKAGN
jgi:phospholipid transport system substrate-binding protein